MHDGRDHQASLTAPGPPATLTGGQEGFQALPELLNQIPWLVRHIWCPGGQLVLPWLRWRWALPAPPSVMVAFGLGLMPPAPARPTQHRLRTAHHQQDQLPEQVPDFTTAQREFKPRRALKLARLLEPAGFSSPFFGASGAPHSARTTLKKACAHIASVIWRYQPVHERTS